MRKKTSKLRIILDLLFLILMILVLVPQSTGISFHEWGSFIILIPFFLHLLVNWKWIKTNTKTFWKKTNRSRFDYLFNWILYLLMILVTISGIVISEAALPLFGIVFEPDAFWSVLHNASATFLMITLGIHFALHWKWIKVALKNLHLRKDFQHITKITSIVKSSQKEFVFLIGISVICSLLIWLLDYSSWAESLRESSNIGDGEHNKKMPYAWLRYVLPLVKVTVFITVPLFITNGLKFIKNKIWQF